MKYIGSFLLLILPVFMQAQTNTDSTSYTIIGTVVDGNTNSLLVGANIVTNETGTSSNELGEFSIHLNANDTIRVSFVGYKTLSYAAPDKLPGRYLIKFKLYKDSVSLKEVFVFPYPTYREFKEAFLERDEQEGQINIEGVNTYVDKDESYKAPSAFSPASFIYDRLFDKQAKLRRKLKRRKSKINKSMQIDD